MGDRYKDSRNNETIPMIRVGTVISAIDIKRTGRIQCRIVGYDGPEITDANLPYCVPLIPKFLNIIPKKGEIVFIFQYENRSIAKSSQFQTQRFWIGPVISEITKLNFDPEENARSLMADGPLRLSNPVGKDFEGSYPNRLDISLQGRNNADLIFKDKGEQNENGEIWIRAGKFIDTPERNKFNNRDLGYIQLKYGGEQLKRTTEEKIITNYIYDNATTLINVKINTSSSAGETLAGDLTPDEYNLNVGDTVVEIKVTNISDKSEIGSMPAEIFLNRDSALIAAYAFIAPFKIGNWKLKSNANEVLQKYGGAEGVTNQVVFFKGAKKEVKKTIKVIKLVPDKDKKSSVLNFVANKINLISHDGAHTFDLTNPEKLITDEEQEKINNEAHPLVYGDKLLEFLEYVKRYVALHTHVYHGMTATDALNKINVLNFDLDSILNKNINSN
jgi:hypothetical protein